MNLINKRVLRIDGKYSSSLESILIPLSAPRLGYAWYGKVKHVKHLEHPAFALFVEGKWVPTSKLSFDGNTNNYVIGTPHIGVTSKEHKLARFIYIPNYNPIWVTMDSDKCPQLIAVLNTRVARDLNLVPIEELITEHQSIISFWVQRDSLPLKDIALLSIYLQSCEKNLPKKDSDFLSLVHPKQEEYLKRFILRQRKYYTKQFQEEKTLSRLVIAIANLFKSNQLLLSSKLICSSKRIPTAFLSRLGVSFKKEIFGSSMQYHSLSDNLSVQHLNRILQLLKLLGDYEAEIDFSDSLQLGWKIPEEKQTKEFYIALNILVLNLEEAFLELLPSNRLSQKSKVTLDWTNHMIQVLEPEDAIEVLLRVDLPLVLEQGEIWFKDFPATKCPYLALGWILLTGVLIQVAMNNPSLIFRSLKKSNRLYLEVLEFLVELETDNLLLINFYRGWLEYLQSCKYPITHNSSSVRNAERIELNKKIRFKYNEEKKSR